MMEEKTIHEWFDEFKDYFHPNTQPQKDIRWLLEFIPEFVKFLNEKGDNIKSV